MTAREAFVNTPRGRFRTLEWGEPSASPVLFLHGLTAVAEVWGPVATYLGHHRRYVAFDQRGHGDSPHGGPYTIGQFVADTRAFIQWLGSPLHLVGHSMGARVAIATASRYPELLRSVAIVDIGVEASAANIRETNAAISAMPRRFTTEDDALAFAFPRRIPDQTARTVFRARLRATTSGLVWRGSPDAMMEVVCTQRSRSYWREWRSIHIPALFVRGGRSNEVSQTVAQRMQVANPSVQYEEFEGIPHNVPLIAPERLARSLEGLWQRAERPDPGARP